MSSSASMFSARASPKDATPVGSRPSCFSVENFVVRLVIPIVEPLNTSSAVVSMIGLTAQ